MGYFIPGFRPSRSGFHFANAFPVQPVLELPLLVGKLRLGDASRGLCGGMVFAARDLFERGESPPALTSPPEFGSPLYRLLVRRLLASFHLPVGPMRYLRGMTLPDADTSWTRGLRWRTVVRQWPRIQAELHRGAPAALGLVQLQSRNVLRLGENHQVLAYGYELNERDQRLRLFVYDPNYPDDDERCLSLSLVEPELPSAIDYAGGGLVRGFFHTPYR